MNTGLFKQVRAKLFVLAITALMVTMAFAPAVYACQGAPGGGC